MCQPGRPGPHGDGQDGSPGLAAFHSAKSSGSRFSPVWPWATAFSEARSRSGSCPDSAPYALDRADGEVDVAAGDVGVTALEDALDERDDARAGCR